MSIVTNGKHYRIQFADGSFDQAYAMGDPTTSAGSGDYDWQTRFYGRARRRFLHLLKRQALSENVCVVETWQKVPLV